MQRNPHWAGFGGVSIGGAGGIYAPGRSALWRHKIGPLLHHLPAMLEVGGMVVHVTDKTAVSVGKLPFDPVSVVASPVHLGGEQVTEPVRRLLAGEPAGVHDVVRVVGADGQCRIASASEDVAQVAGDGQHAPQ